MKVIITSLEYNEKIGGSLVTHMLAKRLLDLGDEVYMTCKPHYEGIRYFNDYKNYFIENYDYIHIIPEGIYPINSLRSKNVIRWILSKLGTFNGYYGLFPNNEKVFQYGRAFTINTPYENAPELTITIPKLDIFYDKNLERTKGDCILIKKGKYKVKEIPNDATIIDDIDFNDEILSEIFNTHKRFISYDAATYHSVQASLCGCLSVVIPDDDISYDKWVDRMPHMKYGIAYGYENIDYAKQTSNLLHDYIFDLQKNEIDQIKKLRDFYHNNFNLNDGFFSVIIPTMWKTPNIINLLNKLQESKYISEIILIDNNPSRKMDISKITKINYYTEGYNIYINPAYNLGVKMAKNELIALCHDDIIFDVDDIFSMIFKNRFSLRCIGLDKSCFTNDRENSVFLKNNIIDDFWAKLIFMTKSDYIEIPNNIKLMFSEKWFSKIHDNIYSIATKKMIIHDNNNSFNYDIFNSIKHNDFVIWNKLMK